MANFNSEFWYQIYVDEDKDNSLWGTVLYDKGLHGAVFMNATQTEKANNRWQLFSVNRTTYVLRSQVGGHNAFLAAGIWDEEETPGQTVPIMINGTIADDSIYWNISPWGDGTFFMTNGANGTAWHLKKKDNGLLCMDSNIIDPQPGQRWSFTDEQDDVIRDLPQFSTVSLLSSTITSEAGNSPTSGPATTPTTTPTTEPTVEPTSASPGNSGGADSSPGLSTGAKAGIGAGVGGVALIVLILLGLWLWKKRKATGSPPAELGYTNEQHPIQQNGPPENETVKYEMITDDSIPTYEMAQERPPVELPNNTVERNAQ